MRRFGRGHLDEASDTNPPAQKVFISYNRADREWAEWIAGVLEHAGSQPIIQAWDFRPGENFVLRMHEAARDSDFTIAALKAKVLAGSPQPVGITSIVALAPSDGERVAEGRVRGTSSHQPSVCPPHPAGLHGMGGIGKTALAAALAHDPAVRAAFPDGVFWLTISQTPDLFSRQHQLAQALTGQPQVLRDFLEW